MARDRSCRKCGEKIPHWTKINGKSKCLCNRQYCLKCSPWGKHNTKKDIDSPPSIRKSLPFAQWPEAHKKSLIKSNYKRGQERKEKLVEMAGGKCILCGYNRTLNALDFHHINPNEKIFGLNITKLCQKQWDDILAEFKKCDLVCRNCHAEIHENKIHKNSLKKEVITERRIKALEEIEITKRCEICETVFVIPKNNKTRRYCSNACSAIAARKVERPSLEILTKEINEKSWKELAKKYGVTDNSIRKWARRYGIIKCKGQCKSVKAHYDK